MRVKFKFEAKKWTEKFLGVEPNAKVFHDARKALWNAYVLLRTLVWNKIRFIANGKDLFKKSCE